MATFSPVDCSIMEGTDCNVRNVPAIDNFDIDKFLGTWYSAFMLRGGSSWDSTIYHFEQDTQGNLHGYHTGARGGIIMRTYY
jgi:hypothetical protein